MKTPYLILGLSRVFQIYTSDINHLSLSSESTLRRLRRFSVPRYSTMKKISVQKTNDAISLLNQGFSAQKVASHLGISTGMVSKIEKTRIPNREKSKGGRPKLLSAQNEHYIVRKITSGGLDTAVDVRKDLLQHQQVNVSADTIRRALRRNGLKSAAKVKKPLLRRSHIKARLEFAKNHQHWTTADWRRVIWSDETKINRFGSDGRKWCWKEPGKRLQPNHVKKTIKHGGGSIMVWGCMTAEGPGYLAKIVGGLNAELYCVILNEDLIKTIKWYGLDHRKVIFQHDNDPKHTAKKTMSWIKENDLVVLEWPAQSPDLNPIEHLWDHLKRRLANYERMPSGINELWERVQVEWGKIKKDDCIHLIDSMQSRIAAVIEAKGGYTKY